jgi:hypothetical protein
MTQGAGVRSTLAAGTALILLAVGSAVAWAQEESTGPEIVFFGVLRADNTIVDPNGVDDSGRLVYDRPFGSGFWLVVEAKQGASAEQVGEATFSDSGCPDLQIQVSRPLGDGSPAVCDATPPNDGGVPAVNPPDLSDDPTICNALNDLGCRLVDGQGEPMGRLCSEGCVLFPSGDQGCVSPEATSQFCGLIAKSAEFATGETLVTARVRDVEGNLGPPAQIVIRVAIPTQTPTPTPTATMTPTSTATLTSTVTPTPYVDDDGCAIVPPDGSATHWPIVLLFGAVSLMALRVRSTLGSPREREGTELERSR